MRTLGDTCTLTRNKFQSVEQYWIWKVQHEQYEEAITILKAGKPLPCFSKLLAFHPKLDENGILPLGGRIHVDLAKLPFSKRYPIILCGSHRLTKLLIEPEHSQLLHAGLTLVAASLAHDYCIINEQRTICAITKGCVTCKRAKSDTKL